MVAVVESGCFVCVRDGSGEDSDSGDARGVGESDSTDVVGGGGDLAGAAGSVGVVEEFGSGEGGVLVEVVGTFGVLEEEQEEVGVVGGEDGERVEMRVKGRTEGKRQG